MVIWIAAVLMITAVALFIAAPLSEHSGSTDLATRAEAQNYEHEHALAVQALRELEFDHAMGKLDGDDYRALRKKLEIRALATAVSPNRTALAAMPERRVEIVPSSTLARAAAENLCVQCGARFDQAHHFCPNCGAARAIQASV